MRKISILLICFTLVGVVDGFAAAARCPAPESGLSVQGPVFRTNAYGRSQLVCRYYDRQYRVGTVEVFYYGDYRQPRECGSRVYANADLRSWRHQIYAFVTDEDPDDFLTETYWGKLAKDLMGQAEQWALPCGPPRAVLPLTTDPRNNRKPISNKTIESDGPEPERKRAIPTPLQTPSLKAVPAGTDDGW